MILDQDDGFVSLDSINQSINDSTIQSMVAS